VSPYCLTTFDGALLIGQAEVGIDNGTKSIIARFEHSSALKLCDVGGWYHA
jgi:hypothetical protein